MQKYVYRDVKPNFLDIVGNVACDFYHRYKEDLGIAKRLHASSYRFSIAWTRIYPNGDDTVNKEGLKFYSDVIDYMLSLGIEPAVTLYHWDLPQVTYLLEAERVQCSIRKAAIALSVWIHPASF